MAGEKETSCRTYGHGRKSSRRSATLQHFDLNETRIPNKYKELMGIAVHAGTKCRYCTLFHTELARMYGATDEEIQEAVHYAKYTLGWSAYLNGMQTDYDQFAKELKKIGEHMMAKV
jgi:AhpD family alkylhydroperoxidase